MKIDNGGKSVKVHSAPENSEGNEFPTSISGYHPFEEIDDPVGHDEAHVNASRLSDAQIARTVVEVFSYNSNFPLSVQIMHSSFFEKLKYMPIVNTWFRYLPINLKISYFPINIPISKFITL